MKRGSEHDCSRGKDLTISYLRLLAPPLQLFSAAMWQVVQQGLVDHYGMLEEFITAVTELVPELMSYSQRAQLVMGLRARLVLDLCRGENPADLQTIQPHLDRIKAPISTAKDSHVTINQVEESEVNFVELVHTLLDDPTEREHFFRDVFPVHFGSKYNTALEMLVWEFISRLEEVLPVPDFTQMVAWLGDSPSFLDDCLQSFSPPEDMKAVLEQRRNHIQAKDPGLLPMDDCILSSLSVPPMVLPSDVPSSLEKEEPSEVLIDSPMDRGSGMTSDAVRHAPKERRSSAEEENRAQSSVDVFPRGSDVTSSSPPLDPGLSGGSDVAANGGEHSIRGGRVLRKRKSSGGLEVPPKRYAEASSAFLDASGNVNSSADSPLISIWGEYTDSEGGSSYPTLGTTPDAKVPWSDDETLSLLDVWGEGSVQSVLRGSLKNRHVYTLIAQQMVLRGHRRTAEQCQTRIKRLKKCFRQCLHNNSLKGKPRLECKFYEQLERVLGTSSTSVPEVTYELEEGTSGDPQEGEDPPEHWQVLDHAEDPQDGPPEHWQVLDHAGTQEDVGTRSVPWTDLETQIFITIWGEDATQKELRTMHRNGHIYAAISNKMAAHGFSRTAEQCQTRVKRLKSSFRQCYDNNMKGQERVECKFYDQLERVLRKEITSPAVPGLGDDAEPEETATMEEVYSLYSHQEMDVTVGVQEERKKVPWTDRETVILLELWGDHQVQQNLSRRPHNGHIFSQISEKLSASGYWRTADQCHTRIKRLKATYRQCQDSMSSSGTDRVDFKFYDLLERILERRPSSSSTLLSDSIEIIEDGSNDGSVVDDMETGVGSEQAASSSVSSWSDADTLALIAVWGDPEVQCSLRGVVHNGHVYGDIAESMCGLGHAKTPEQCRWKVKALRSNFRQCYDKKRRGVNTVEYKFYKQLERILGPEAISMDQYDEQDEEDDQNPAVADGSRLAGAGSAAAAWSEVETLALIEVWAADDVQHGLCTSVRNAHVFADMAERLADMGHRPRTAEQCHSRVNRLRRLYRCCCDSLRSGREPMAFRYYQVLQPVLGDIYADVDGPEPCGEALYTDTMSDEAAASTSGQFLLLPPAASEESSRKQPWSDLETRVLLEMWGEDETQATLRASLKNRHVFDFISQRMKATHGFSRTSEQCYTRIKRLKHAFLHDREEFRFYEQMEEIFTRELQTTTNVDGETSMIPEEPAAHTNQSSMLSDGADTAKLPWSEGETRVLLEIWGSVEVQGDLKSSTKHKNTYGHIAQALAAQGYQRTAQQCQSRVKRLKANFRQFCEGTPSGGDKLECKFFEELLNILGSKYLSSDPLADESLDVTESGACPPSP